MQVAALLALVLAATSPEAKKDPTTTEVVANCKLVCKSAKKQPAKKVKKKVVAHAARASQYQSQGQQQVVIVNVYQAQAQGLGFGGGGTGYHYVGPWTVIGLRGAVGLWSCSPHVFAQVGLRVRFPSAFLGAEVNTQFYWGHGVQLMAYPIQGPTVNWHVNVGMLWHAHYAFGAQDVPRNWDMTFGTGIEVRILPWMSFTADLRTAIPNPVTLAKYQWPDEDGHHLNIGNVVGNSLLRTQLTTGLMFHTW